MAKALKIPLRTAEIAFDGLYEGFHATVRTNPTYGTKLDLQAGGERFAQGLKAIVISWDLVDDSGPIPPGEPERVPDDLLGELVKLWADKLGEAATLPKA